MEQPIERQLHNLSVSMEEPMENQFARVLSLPFQQTEKQHKFQNIRITLYSRFPDVVDEVAAAVVSDAKEMHLRVCGPTVLPNRVSYITTRLAAGEYHRTRDFALQLYGRAIDVLSSTEVVEQIMSDCDDHFVKMEFEVVDLKLVQA